MEEKLDKIIDKLEIIQLRIDKMEINIKNYYINLTDMLTL